MATPPLSKELMQEAVDAYVATGGKKSEAARELNLHTTTFVSRLKAAARAGLIDLSRPVVGGKVEEFPEVAVRGPRRGGVKRFLLTSAQNNTHLAEGAWANLMALGDHYGIPHEDRFVGTFSYNKAAYGSKAVKRGTKRSSDSDDVWYAPEVVKHFRDERVQLAPGLVWCGEHNILPTAADPLSGLDTYTGRRSGIFPHAKIELRSVPSNKFEPTKFNYTTGVITQRNYIQKKEGLKAEALHAYGGLIVEVDWKGNWFVRQLHCGEDFSVHDLDLRVQAGVVSTRRVEAITWGDIHVASIDPTVRALAFGAGGMLDALQPRYQFFHDVLDFRSRNHHDRRNPHKFFEKWRGGVENVRQELMEVRDFLAVESRREGCLSVVVDSNHDDALERWLRDDPAAYAWDPVNAVFFLECQLAKYRAMQDQLKSFHLMEHMLVTMDVGGCRFLRPDESFVTCKGKGDGIEHGMHGHLGANGAYGTSRGMVRLSRPSTIGHHHSPEIRGLVHTVGTSSLLDMGWNEGPSSWSHTHGVDYENGRRALITMWDGKYRA